MRASVRSQLPQLRARRPLGATGLEVSPFCLGLVSHARADTVAAAFDAGINFFFVTSDLHWPYYEWTRRGLVDLLARRPSVRDQIVVAVTSYAGHGNFVPGALSEVLAAVPGLERADVAVIGGAHMHDLLPRVEFVDRWMRRTGLVRSVAATLHDRAAGVTAFNRRLVDAAFIRYNPEHPGARKDLFPALDPASPTLLYNFKNTVGWLDDARWSRLGLGDAHWRPDITDYYRFALSQPMLDGLLCGLGSPDEVAALDRAVQRGPLDDEEQAYLMDLVLLARGAKQKVTPAADA